MAESLGKLPRARIRGYEKTRGAQRSTEKAGGALRYTLIITLEVRAKSAREARASGSYRGNKEGARYRRRKRFFKAFLFKK